MSQSDQEDRYYRLETFLNDIVSIIDRVRKERNLTAVEVLAHHKAEGFLREIALEQGNQQTAAGQGHD